MDYFVLHCYVKNFLMKKNILFLGLFLISTFCTAQFYIGGGYVVGLGNFSTLNDIKQEFNDENGHDLGNYNSLMGYELGFGVYGIKTVAEMKWVSMNRRQDSKVLGAFIENATGIASYNHASISFGYKPLNKQYMTIGASVNIGQIKTKYSFGGDFVTTNRDYTVSNDFYFDYAIPFYLKKKNKDSMNPLLLRIRPYYQLHYLPVDLRDLQIGLNQATEEVPFRQFDQKFNNYGLKISLVKLLGKKQEELDYEKSKLFN